MGGQGAAAAQDAGSRSLSTRQLFPDKAGIPPLRFPQLLPVEASSVRPMGLGGAGVQDVTVPAPSPGAGPTGAPGRREPQTSPRTPGVSSVTSMGISALCPSLCRACVWTRQAAGSGKELLSHGDIFLTENNLYLESAAIQAARLRACSRCYLAGEEGPSSFCLSANPPPEHE